MMLDESIAIPGSFVGINGPMIANYFTADFYNGEPRFDRCLVEQCTRISLILLWYSQILARVNLETSNI